jgi:Na+-driven multidrug efflux pump
MRVANTFENSNLLLVGNSLSLGLNILLNFIFIEQYGVIGIPIATFIAYCIMVLFWFLPLIGFSQKLKRHSASACTSNAWNC